MGKELARRDNMGEVLAGGYNRRDVLARGDNRREVMARGGNREVLAGDDNRRDVLAGDDKKRQELARGDNGRDVLAWDDDKGEELARGDDKKGSWRGAITRGRRRRGAITRGRSSQGAYAEVFNPEQVEDHRVGEAKLALQLSGATRYHALQLPFVRNVVPACDQNVAHGVQASPSRPPRHLRVLPWQQIPVTCPQTRQSSG